MFRWIFGLFFVLVGFAAQADPVLNSAVLPNARVVPLDDPATIFMTTTNSGDMDATNCQIVPSSEIGFRTDFTDLNIGWVLTDAAGALVGDVNDPFSIPAGGLAQLVLGIERSETAGPFDTSFHPIFHVECDGGFGSPGRPAVNRANIQFTNTNPDIIPIVQTFSADGIANFDEGNRLAVISVAALNNSAAVGEEEDVGVSGMYLGFRDGGQFKYFACETDSSGQCIDPLITCIPNPHGISPCFTTKLGRDPKTYAFFVILPEGEGANFFPGVYRFAASFRNSFGTLVASSSVALDSADPVIIGPPSRPNGQYEVSIRNTADLNAHTLRKGTISISDRSLTGRIFRTVDRGAFIQIFQSYFRGEPDFVPPADQPLTKGLSKAQADDTWAVFFTLVWFDDLLTEENDGGWTVEDAALAMPYDARGGTIDVPDTPGEQHVNQPLILDVGEPARAHMVAYPGPFYTEKTALDDASRWSVSSTPENGGGNYDIDLDAPPIGSVLGSTFTEPGGCEIEITLLELFQQIDRDLEALSTMAIKPTSCPTGHKLEPFVGVERFGNVENFGPDRIQTTHIFGDIDDSNAAVLHDTYFSIAPLDSPEGSQVQTSKPADTERYQKIANERGKPVYLHLNGKNVLVARPDVKLDQH